MAKALAQLRAAIRAVKAGIPTLNGFIHIAHQKPGRGANKRTAWIDPTRIRDPEAWLSARLGPVKVLS